MAGVGRCSAVGSLGSPPSGWDGSSASASRPATETHAQAPDRPAPAAAPAETSDYGSRIVAYIHGSIPITREELGEYLIARYGADKLDLLINKRIIEHACAEKHIQVTNAEIEADLDETTKGISVSRKDFIDKILKSRHLTMYEWKEDVVRPKLLLAKLARDRIRIEDQEIADSFEAEYGEKVDCRIIHFPPGHPAVPTDYWQKIRSSESEFDHAGPHSAQRKPGEGRRQMLAYRASHHRPGSRTGHFRLEARRCQQGDYLGQRGPADRQVPRPGAAGQGSYHPTETRGAVCEGDGTADATGNSARLPWAAQPGRPRTSSATAKRKATWCMMCSGN